MKRFLLFSVLFCLVSAMAMQAANRDFVLVDAKGSIVADKATLSFTKVENASFGPQIKSGLSVRNTSGKELNIMLVVEIVEIGGKEAALEVCFPAECNMWSKKGAYRTASRKFAAKAKDTSIATDFNLKGKDHCTVVLKFYTTNSPESDEMAEPERLLTTVTLKFKGDATGIESVKVTEPNTSNEVWTVQGTFVGRNITNLNSLPKGLYLVHQNGKTTKVVVGK